MERVRLLPNLIAAGFIGAMTISQAIASEVSLQSLDGGTTLRGDLLNYDGRSYRLRTILVE